MGTPFHKRPPGWEARKAEDWYIKELKLISEDLEIFWNNKTKRWVIFQGGDPNRIVENLVHKDSMATIMQQQIGSYRPLDQRLLRKLRVDTFFTRNPGAFEAYLAEDAYAMYTYTERGMQGLIDYLSE